MGAWVSSSSVLRTQIESVLANRIPAALTVRPAVEPERIPFGVPVLDQRSEGIPRGCLTEICGPTSSGRTTLILSVMREVTQQGECCALIDTTSALDPLSAAANGVNLKRLLWVKCSASHPKLTPIDKALHAADWIINAGGFGLIVLDLADIRPQLAQKIPLASWYRFRRAIESTSAALVVIEQQPFAKSCASLVIRLEARGSDWETTRRQPQNPKLLTSIQFAADVTRSRIDLSQRKPPGHAGAEFCVATSWAG
jgi:recombination protein RecA